MYYNTFNLRTEPTASGFMPKASVYIPDKVPYQAPNATVVICPGGGYAMKCDDREGDKIALMYLAAGFAAVVVDYSVAPDRYPDGLLDLAAAVKLCRDNADEWYLDKDRIVVLGFSAGGHLAADLSVEWNNTEIFGEDAVKNRTYRPDLSVLCYPVITSDEKYIHSGSFENLLGSKNPSDWEKLSLEKLVDDNTPPAFLWSTFEDYGVPFENALLYAKALREHKIHCEFHVFENGGHGLDTVTESTYRNIPLFKRPYPWVQLSIEWIESHFPG